MCVVFKSSLDVLFHAGIHPFHRKRTCVTQVRSRWPHQLMRGGVLASSVIHQGYLERTEGSTWMALHSLRIASIRARCRMSRGCSLCFATPFSKPPDKGHCSSCMNILNTCLWKSSPPASSTSFVGPPVVGNLLFKFWFQSGKRMLTWRPTYLVNHNFETRFQRLATVSFFLSVLPREPANSPYFAAYNKRRWGQSCPPSSTPCETAKQKEEMLPLCQAHRPRLELPVQVGNFVKFSDFVTS